MKKRKVTILTSIMIVVLGMVLLIGIKNREKKLVKNETKLEKIKLNHIAMSADDYEIEKVKFSSKIKKELVDRVKLYKVNAKKYNNKQIREIVKKGMRCNIKSSSEDDNAKIFELSNGGDLTYYKNSGTISYHFYDEKKIKTSKRTISNDKLKDKAREFVKRAGIYDISQLRFYKANPSITVKTTKGEEIEQYEVMYTKIPPQGIDGYEGTGPGVVVEFDCTGEVVGFVSIDKEIELTKKEYPAKDTNEIKNDIVNENNVMIYANKEVKREVTLDSVECVLYSDSVEEEQEYMVPHYKFEDKNQNGIDIVMPAVKKSYITIK